MHSAARGHAHTLGAYPLAENQALYDAAQVETFITTLFRNVDWEDGQVVSILGIGEKGTLQDGSSGKPPFRERKIIPPAFMGAAHDHLKRWAAHHVAGFIVPAVLHPSAVEAGDVTLDKVAALTAIIADLDSGDTDAKLKYAETALGRVSMLVASGGQTEAGKPKMHAYWLLTEPCEDVERVSASRKQLAAKIGADQAFGRATQVIRIAGSVHAKNGKASVCRILRSDALEYDFDDLAEIVEAMLPMPGLPAPKQPDLPSIQAGVMDFTPKMDTAIAALHRDIHEHGEDLTRWGEFSKVAGFNIAEARAGRLTPEAAYAATNGWMLQHMHPAWSQARFDQEFQALVKVDITRHGPFPARLVRNEPSSAQRELPLEFFSDIAPALRNNWLVREWLVNASLALIYGFPGSGKSFFALDLALRLAVGWAVNGASVKQCPVVYVAAEGQSGLRNRVAAFRMKRNPKSDVSFALVPTALNLLDPHADLANLVAAIRKASNRWGLQPGLVVIDTLAATMAAGDENTSDMAAYINNLAVLRDELGSAVCVVHHRPKDQQNDTPRGHSSLMGAMDTIIKVEATDKLRAATITKQKDAEHAAPMHFELCEVILGEDEEGQPVTSAVVEYLAAPAKRTKLSNGVAEMLAALASVIDRQSGTHASETDWREEWRERRPDMKEESFRRTFARNRDVLVRAGRAILEAGLWRIVSDEVQDNSVIMDFNPVLRRA